MSRPRLLFALVAVLSLVFVVPATADTINEAVGVAKPISRTVDDTVAAVGISTTADDSAAEQRRTHDYWSQERRSAAQPVPTERRDGIFGPGVLSQVPTSQLPSTKNTAAGGSATPWTNNGGIIPTVGKVFFTLMGQDYVCTATVVDSGNRDTVVTAGHCVNNGPGEFATNWLFVPGYDNGAEPYGSWTAHSLFAPQQWSGEGNLDYDIGFAALNTSNGAHVADVVGTQQIDFHAARGQYINSFGYPAISPYNGESLYQCPATAVQDTHGGTGQGIDCDMTEGSSGGPWFAGFNSGSGQGIVVSVNSFGYDDTPNVMWGPYFGDVAGSIYQTAQAA